MVCDVAVEQPGAGVVGDHVGRSIWALGDVLTTAWVPALVEPAQLLLSKLIASLSGEVSLRTAAYIPPQ